MNINQFIKKKDFVVMGEKTTVCLLTLYNGFEVVGVSTCVNPNQLNVQTGRLLAEQDASDKVKQLIGFRRQDRQFHSEDLPF